MMPDDVPDPGRAGVVGEPPRTAAAKLRESITNPGASMDLVSFLAVGLGAFAGAVVRWLLGLALNPILPSLPLGTLAANLIGGLVMGLALGAFAHFETLPLAWRLAVTTGFLGGLTTFSTFSGETVTLFLRQQYGWTAAIIAAHLFGSLLLTLAGIGIARLVLRT
jgi:CrcB protein